MSRFGQWGALATVLLFGVAGAQRQRPPIQKQHPPIKVVSVGPPKLIYDTGRDGCTPWDYPDASARAFRDASGTIHFFMSTSTNRAMVGPDFAHLKHRCDIAYKGAENASPAAYDDHGWLSAFYAQGDNVWALVHNEFHAYAENKKLCPKSAPNSSNCSEVSIHSVMSHDGGYHFKRIGGTKALVAEMPYRFEEEPHWWGDMGPTSIVKHGVDYYALISMIHPTDRAKNGVCVLHTRTVSDPESWRGWDGTGFTVQFVDPYEVHVVNPDAHLCKPLPRDAPIFAVDTLNWSPARQSYVLVTRVQKWDKPAGGEAPGAYLQESKDMIHWDKPVLLLSDAEAGGENLYPSLIDPSSPDQNFSTLGNTAILYTKIGNNGYKSWKVVAREVRLRYE